MPEKSETRANHYCNNCKGVGICQYCKYFYPYWDNSGDVLCVKCDGKKICPRCNGTGQSNLVD
jgi:hypothetical protein